MNIQKMSNDELYKYSRKIGSKAQMWKRQFVALLPEIAKREIHKEHGFATIVEFAGKVGGVSKSTVERVFQVSRKIHDKPDLQKILSEVGVHKMKIVAIIATKENQKELAEKALKMSKHALEENIKAMRNESGDIQNDNLFSQIRPGADREYIGFHVDKEIALELRKYKQRLEKERGAIEWNEVMKAFLESVKEQPKKIRKSKKTKITRQASAQEKREAFEKYNGGCAFPDCNKPATELHHPDRFSLNKSHKRLTPLCKTHHELAHHGLIGNEEKEPEIWFIKEQSDKSDPMLTWRWLTRPYRKGFSSWAAKVFIYVFDFVWLLFLEWWIFRSTSTSLSNEKK